MELTRMFKFYNKSNNKAQKIYNQSMVTTLVSMKSKLKHIINNQKMWLKQKNQSLSKVKTLRT